MINGGFCIIFLVNACIILSRDITVFFFSSVAVIQLALRAGNEKEEGETADTVGCCSLRVEHIKLHEEDEGQEFVVEFDFLGKDSIRYQNKVPVEKRVSNILLMFKSFAQKKKKHLVNP